MKRPLILNYNSVNTNVVNNEHKDFKFPQKLLDQIDECSNGGIILFTIDAKGSPVAHTKCDTMTHLLGMQCYVSAYAKMMEEMQVDNLVESFIKPLDEEDGDGFEL